MLDVLQDDPRWAQWSLAQLTHATTHRGGVINPIIYAELSVWYDDVDVFKTVVNDFQLTFRELPRDALFLAGKAFRQYRARRGTRSGVLPDFFIGAHAAVSEYPVLTRDTRRIRGYFPTVALLSPEQA